MLDETTLTWVAGAALMCFVLEKLTLSLAHKYAVFSEPNARSSHTRATPAIGGVAIVVPVLCYCAYQLNVDTRFLILFVASLVLLLLGLWDDLKPLSSRFRLVLQILVMTFSLQYLDITGQFSLYTYNFSQSGLLTALLTLAAIWFLNLFNFMDGIDGIAASQCALYCLAVCYLATGLDPGMLNLLLILAVTSSVFLLFNWPPARIFMGDAGSGVLGYLIVMIALVLNQEGQLPLLASLILLSVFWFDATYTLCVRLLSGQRFTTAHRSHLYQKLAIIYGHQKVSLGFSIYALLVLMPLAGGAINTPSWGIIALCIACAPTLALSLRFRAGLID